MDKLKPFTLLLPILEITLLILLFHLQLEELLLNGFLLCHHHPHPGLDAHPQLLPVPAPYVRAPASMAMGSATLNSPLFRVGFLLA